VKSVRRGPRWKPGEKNGEEEKRKEGKLRRRRQCKARGGYQSLRQGKE
jgi:hypothetical protein